MNRILRRTLTYLPLAFILLVFLLLPALMFSQSYTTFAGSKVKDGQGRQLGTGSACLVPYNSAGSITAITPSGGAASTGPFCTPVRDGVFSVTSLVPNLATASPSGLNYQLVIYDASSTPILTVDWLTSVTGAAWSYDTQLVIPAPLTTVASASGLGAPYLSCAQGATYMRTDLPDSPNLAGWTCNMSNGYPQWFQGGNFPSPSPQQTATIPVVAQMIADAIHAGGGGGAPGGPTYSLQYNPGTGLFSGFSGDGIAYLSTTAAPRLVTATDITNLIGTPLVRVTTVGVGGLATNPSPGVINIPAIPTGGGGTPGGTNGHLQFNLGGVFGGDTGTTTDGAGHMTVKSLTGSDGTGVAGYFRAGAGTSPPLTAGTALFTADASGNAVVDDNGGALARICTALNSGSVTGCGGGSATLPTATAPGQIITSTAAGTTYAVQSQTFYQQSTDTIASIETECSSLCTYHITGPQTMTLAADHTLSANVQLAFEAGGLWTIAGGHTLTIAGNVTGGLLQHFAGATVKFGLSQALVPVEWFGAIGDCNTTATSCTDNSTTIQTALNSLTAGQVLLQPKTYLACGLTITVSDVGMKGAKPQTVFDPHWSRIICNSASATILALSGPGGGTTTIFGNIIEDITFSRSLAPTGTATGISVSFVTPTIRHVTSEDSYRDFYMIGAGSIELDNDGAEWGINGFSISTGNLYGFYFDGSTGFPNNSARIIQCDVVGGGTGSAVSYGLYSTGTKINDMWAYLFNTNGQDYGVYINYTGAGGLDSAADVQFIDSILDFSHINAIHVAGLNSSLPDGLATIEFIGGWADNDLAGSTPVVDIENSTGVTIQGLNIADQFSTAAIYLNSSTGNVINANNIRRFSNHGIELNNSNANTIASNTLVGSFDIGTPATHHIHLTGTSSYNSITANSMSGNGSVGMYFDTSVTNNAGIGTNTVSPTNITTPVTYVASVINNAAHAGALIVDNLTTGTSPICPNGTSGALTTVGCGGGLAGSGTTGYVPAYTGSTALGNSHFDDGVTHAGETTLHQDSFFIAPAASSGLSADVFLVPDGGDEWLFFANGSGHNPGWFGLYEATTNMEFGLKSTDATHGFVVLDPNTVMGFSSAAETLPDTGISRCGAGHLCIGNGTKANVSAEMDGTTFFAGVTGAAAFQMNASQLQGQNSSGVQTIALNGAAGSVLGNYFLPGTIYKATGGTALPTCGVGIKGAIAVVSDATTPTYNGTYTSGGLITVPVVCSYNGTTYAWLTH